jgi:3-methyladenine DNA glycosylase AlkD
MDVKALAAEVQRRRRAAVVSTVPLNKRSQGGSGDPERTLAICTLVAADHDDRVAKGLSWALRELISRDRRAVRRFLEENDAALGARVRREVRNKLRTGRKNP